MEQDMRFGLVWGQFAFIMNWAVEYTTFAVNFGQNIFSLNIVVSTPKLYIPSTLNIDLLLWHTLIREMLSLGRPEYFYLPCGDQK